MKLTTWSKSFSQCVQCNQTDRPHFGKGLCRRCYLEQYNRDNAAKVQALRRKWYEENITPEFAKQKREEENYGGLREAALKRDGYKCTRCPEIRLLVVHHRDENGRPQPKELKNNTLENLVTLCRACHMKIHAAKIYAARNSRLNYWAPKFKLFACLNCQRSDRLHQRDGFCQTCATAMLKNGRWKPKTKGRFGAPKGKWN